MATPYSQLPWGFRRGEENYAYGEYLRRQRELQRATDFADRIAAEKERISLSQWQPEPEEQEVKIKTKADGTSTIVSTEKYPAQSLLDDPMGLEGTGTGDWGLSVTGDTISQAEIDEYNRINDLYTMGGQGDIGEVWPSPAVDPILEPVDTRPANQQDILIPDYIPRGWKVSPEMAAPEVAVTEPVISPEGTPIAGFDMGGLQRFEPHIIPDEAYRQAYGDQERVMGMMGLLEEEIPPTIVPPPTFQTIEPQPQMPMVDRAIEQADRGTANILPPIDFPPVQPGGGGAGAPFVAPQAITPEQGPLGPPMLAGVSPEMELQAALGEGAARYGEALPMQGLLTDEEILAGAQMPYGDIGVTPMERALMEAQEGPPVVDATPDIFADEAAPLTSEDIFGGVSPVTPVDPVDPGLRPRGRVETDILESQAEGWIDPDTGKPFRGEMYAPLPKGAMRDASGEFNKLVQKVSAKTGISEEDIDTDMILDIKPIEKTVDKMYKMQKMSAMMALVEGMKKKSKARSLRGVGRQRQGRQMQLLNPTPLQMEG